MTEAEWLTCDDPVPMLTAFNGRFSDRKRKLFCMECCRRIQHLTSDRDFRKAMVAAEGFAEGVVSDTKLARVDALIAAKVGQKPENMWSSISDRVNNLVLGAAHQATKWGHAHYFAIRTAKFASEVRLVAEGMQDSKPQAIVLRDIIGNPFFPLTIAPIWLTPKVVTLASTIYEQRTIDQMPALAEALEEAGCTDAAILEHCRSKTDYVRGCWVVDGLLGKS